jgi:hypothetical protein
MPAIKNTPRVTKDLSESGFIDVVLDTEVELARKPDPRNPTSNEQSIESSASLIPILVSAVVDILTIGAIAPHRPAIRRHLSDRALDAAISKLQSIRRER